MLCHLGSGAPDAAAASEASLSGGPPPAPTSAVHALCFFDADVVASAAHALGGEPPLGGYVGLAPGARWAVLAAEGKLGLALLGGEAAPTVQDAPRSLLDRSTPLSLAVLPPPAADAAAGAQPLLAVGCSDGCVRLLSLEPGLPPCVRHRLQGRDRVSALQSVPPDESNPDIARVAAAGSGGALALWEFSFSPGATPPGAEGAEHAPQRAPAFSAKAHGAEILALAALSQARGPLASARAQLLSTGADCTTAGWAVEAAALRELWRVRLDARVAINSLAAFPGGGGSFGAVLAGKAPSLWVLPAPSDGGGDAPRLAGSLSALAPPWALGKSEAKCYAAVAHSSQPGVAAFALNVGVTVVALRQPQPPPAAVALTQGVALAAARGSLWVVRIQPPAPLPADSQRGAAAPRQGLEAHAAPAAQLQAGASAGPCELHLSPDRAAVALLWPSRREFELYLRSAAPPPHGSGGPSERDEEAAAGGWTRAASGAAMGWAWDCRAPRRAVVLSADGTLRCTDFSQGAGLDRPDAPLPRLRSPAARVHGGAALGVLVGGAAGGAARPAAAPAASRGLFGLGAKQPAQDLSREPAAAREPQALQLFSWADAQPLCEPLPPAALVSWSPAPAPPAAAAGSLCLLGYPQLLAACTLLPGGPLRLDGRLHIAGAMSVAWILPPGGRPQDLPSAAVLSPTAAHIVHWGVLPAAPGVSVSCVARLYPSPLRLPLALEAARLPPGPLTLLGATPGALWVVDGLLRVTYVPVARAAG